MDNVNSTKVIYRFDTKLIMNKRSLNSAFLIYSYCFLNVISLNIQKRCGEFTTCRFFLCIRIVAASELGPQLKITTLVGSQIFLSTTLFESRIFISTSLVPQYFLIVLYTNISLPILTDLGLSMFYLNHRYS
jgi:hypothetical protein